MTISIYRWTNGPFLAFNDQDGKRYILDESRAVTLLDRLSAHFDPEADQSLVVDRHFTRDARRDLTVIDIYLQDCEDLFEVMSATGPVLLTSRLEAGTLLHLAAEHLPQPMTRQIQKIPEFVQESAIALLANTEGFMDLSHG